MEAAQSVVTLGRSIFAGGLAAVGLCGCTSPLPPESFAEHTPEMRPEIFFAGATASRGVVENSSGAPIRRFQVKGVGRALPDGTFSLEQSITFDAHAPEQRTWILTRLDAHHYSATLTDASGPVAAEAYGDLFHLRYPMKTPPGGRMEQWLYLQPDGRTVMNSATVRVLGVVVARLTETITHEDR